MNIMPVCDNICVESFSVEMTGPTVSRGIGGTAIVSQNAAEFMTLNYSLLILNEGIPIWRAFCVKANRGEIVRTPCSTKWLSKRSDGSTFASAKNWKGSQTGDWGTAVWDRASQGIVEFAASPQSRFVTISMKSAQPVQGSFIEIAGQSYMIESAVASDGGINVQIYTISLWPRLRQSVSVGTDIFLDSPLFKGRVNEPLPLGKETAGPEMRVDVRVEEAV